MPPVMCHHDCVRMSLSMLLSVSIWAFRQYFEQSVVHVCAITSVWLCVCACVMSRQHGITWSLKFWPVYLNCYQFTSHLSKLTATCPWCPFCQVPLHAPPPLFFCFFVILFAAINMLTIKPLNEPSKNIFCPKGSWHRSKQKPKIKKKKLTFVVFWIY